MPAEIYHIKGLERSIKEKQDSILVLEHRIKLLEDLILANFHILSGVQQYVGSLNLVCKPPEEY